MNNYYWELKHFNDLSLKELYEILRLRNEVFIVEQNCPFQDMDYLDYEAWHFGCWENDQLLAYTRLLKKGTAYEEYCSIGRVITKSTARNTGLGKVLMTKSIEQAHQLFNNEPIKIGAQKYLSKFYQSFDFQQFGDEYLEDGIPHIPMILNKL